MKPQTAIQFVVVLAVLIILIGAGAFLWRQFNGTAPDSEGQNAPIDFFSGLFPFNGGSGTRTPSNDERGEGDINTRPVSQLRKVSASPVSGARFTKESAIRFIEKETGHVFETKPDEHAVVRLSNTTLPGIQDVAWMSDDTFVLRSLSDDEQMINVLGTLQGTSTERTITIKPFGVFSRIAQTPNGKSVLAVTETADGSRIERADTNGGLQPRLIMTSPVRSWVPQTGGNDLFLETAPSENIPGFLYEIDTASQSLTRVAGGQRGFMATVSPSGRYVLYSSGVGTAGTLSILDRFADTTYSVSLPTVADKCAWFTESEPLLFCGVPRNSTGNLDAWLMGTVSFEDNAWIIEPIRDASFFVRELTDENGSSIDVIHPETNADGSFVLFTNKNDSSLWSLRVDDAIVR